MRHDPYEIVRWFEEEVAEYAGAKYGIAVESCTNALFLSLLYCKVQAKTVTIPNKTYIGVMYSIINAGGIVQFNNKEWCGAYQLEPYPIIDSARRFRKGMYEDGTYHCLSFHWSKHLPIGRGGMILTDDFQACEWFRRMRFDGRTEGVPAKYDNFDLPNAYHFYMTPELAARGLMLMQNIKDDNPDLIELHYPDLSQSTVYKNQMIKFHNFGVSQ